MAVKCARDFIIGNKFDPVLYELYLEEQLKRKDVSEDVHTRIFQDLTTLRTLFSKTGRMFDGLFDLIGITLAERGSDTDTSDSDYSGEEHD